MTLEEVAILLCKDILKNGVIKSILGRPVPMLYGGTVVRHAGDKKSEIAQQQPLHYPYDERPHLHHPDDSDTASFPLDL